MSVFPKEFQYIGSRNTDLLTGFLDCQGFTHLNIMVFSNDSYIMYVDWSLDGGINTDYQDYKTTTGTDTLSVKIRA